MPTFGSLFAGIGGMDLGLERAGWECRWQVEIDSFCQRVLAKHWPDVPRYGDVKEVDDLPTVDLICGGFPCQPVSHAGKGLAQADPRWLWPEFHRIIRLVRPSLVLVENVPGLLRPGKGMGDVLGDLASSGYDAEWDCIPAAAVGAPHLRYRVWIVAHRQADAQRPDSNGVGSHRAEVHEYRRPEQGRAELRDEQEREPGPMGEEIPNPNGSRLSEQSQRNGQSERIFHRPPWNDALGRGLREWWATEPAVGRVADGVPARVDRLRSLGNAVVPQVAEWIGRRLMEVA